MSSAFTSVGNAAVLWGLAGFVGVSVSTFGAVGDGVSNDTQAFADAFSQVLLGGKVVMPPGRFLLDKVVVPAQNVTLEGQGRGVTVLVPRHAGAAATPFSSPIAMDPDVPSGTTTYAFISLDQNVGYASGIVLRQFEIDWNGGTYASPNTNVNANASHTGICTSFMIKPIIEDVYVHNVGMGVNSGAAHRSSCFLGHRTIEPTFVRCEADGSGYDAFMFRGASCVDPVMIDCHGGSAKYGSVQWAYNCNRARVIGGVFFNTCTTTTTAHGIYMHGSTAIMLTGVLGKASGASCSGLQFFGDNGPNNTNDSHDSAGTGWAATDDRYGECVNAVNCVFESLLGSCVGMNSRYARNASFTGCKIIKYSTDGVATCITLDNTDGTTTRPSRNVKFHGCTIRQQTTANAAGITCVDNVTFSDCSIEKTASGGNHGLVFQGCKNPAVIRCHHQMPAAGYLPVRFLAYGGVPCDNFTLEGNTYSGTGSRPWDLDTAMDNACIINNDFRGGTWGNALRSFAASAVHCLGKASPTGLRAYGNLGTGFKDSARGTATLLGTTAATQITVTHGLGNGATGQWRDYTAADIRVTPNNQKATSIAWWVVLGDGAGGNLATQFTIMLSADPGAASPADDVSYTWEMNVAAAA